MSIKLNKTADKYARSLIKRENVDTGSWKLDAAELLGPDGADWELYAKFHLAFDEAVEVCTPERYLYPIGKSGKLSRQALTDARDLATQRGDTEIADAAKNLLALLEKAPHADESARVSRLDWYDSFDWLTEKMTKDQNGNMRGRAVVTNIGVFPYRNADGSMRYELRHPEDVFDEESIKSLDGLPLTNDHPREGVNPDNAQYLTVGSVHTPRTDPYHLTAGVTVFVGSAIKDVEMGKLGLSCGYDCDTIPEVGNYLGTPYTHRQTKIRYNHVALVDAGRAGDAARLRMDGATLIHQTTPKGEDTMKTFKLDALGPDYQADEAVYIALNAAREKAGRVDALEAQAAETKKALDTANAELEAAKKELDTAKGNVDSLTSKVTKLEADLAANPSGAVLDAAVSARVGLLTQAEKLGAKVDAKMSDRDIRVAVINLDDAEANLEGKSDEYVAARFDGAVKNLGKGGTYRLPDAPGGFSHGDTVDTGLAEARAKSKSNLQNAWKKEK